MEKKSIVTAVNALVTGTLSMETRIAVGILLDLLNIQIKMIDIVLIFISELKW